MPVERGFAEVAGTRLYYETAGSGPPLVLVHGFTLDSSSWDDQIDAFAPSHRVIRYDLRGFGQSPPPSAPYTHVDDLKALLDYLGIARAAILGLSMGGGIAIDFALTYPDATQALIAAAPVLGGYRLAPELGASLGAVYKTARSAGIAAAKEQWLAHPFFGPAQEQPAVAPALSRLVAAYTGWHWVNADPARSPERAAVERLEAIAAPTLVVVGEREVPGFRAVADVVATRVPGVRQVVLPGVGHLVNMEAPAQFNQAVLDFLFITVQAGL